MANSVSAKAVRSVPAATSLSAPNLRRNFSCPRDPRIAPRLIALSMIP